MTSQNDELNVQSSDLLPPDSDLHNFLTGAGWYLLGSLTGVVFIIIAYILGIGGWFVNLIPAQQEFIRLLAIPFVVGLLLAISGGILGGFGGWSLAKILDTKKHTRLAVGSGIAFGITSGLLILVFLLVVSFFALYNNMTANRFEQFGLLFGLFGLVFGLVLGLLQAFLTLRFRHTWRIILAAFIGFTLGGLIMGILVRLVTATNLFKISNLLGWIVLILALAIPIALGGGAFGFSYGRLSRGVIKTGETVESALASRWQIIIVAVIGILIAVPFLELLGNITNFLTINPSNIQSKIAPVTVGVAWSEPEIIPADSLPVTIPLTELDHDISSVTGADGVLHEAWCSLDGKIQYRKYGSGVEEIIFPSCNRFPAIALGSDGSPHLVWYTDQIRDTNGVERPASLLVESILNPDGWSEPAIVVQTEGEVLPAMVSDAQSNLHLVWSDPAEAGTSVSYAVKENYQCSREDLSLAEIAGLEQITNSNSRPPGTEIPFCRNRFSRILYTPNPEPAYSDESATPNGAFDRVNQQVEPAQYEVLFTIMQWEETTVLPGPGNVIAGEVAKLYKKVKANPEDYPRGMTVRILLGNYPVIANFNWGDQVKDAIGDMRSAGVDKMVDPEIGWRLEVANFSGTYPHTHTKFLVVDGSSAMSAGFNYGYLHFPKDHPSGKGYDMLDLGLAVVGPVAQDMITHFDDMWEGADMILCEDLSLPEGQWQETCQELKATSDHVPEVLRTYLPPEGDSTSFALYRTKEFKEADNYSRAAMGAATESIDIMQANFSMKIYCMVNLITPDVCTIQDRLPFMDGILKAITENGAKVRVIMENSNSYGLENRVTGRILHNELARLGLEDHLELRFYNGKIHAKALLIDDLLLLIGSQNMHYSAWGAGGLGEHSLTTTDPDAIAEFKGLFEAKWGDAIPFEEAEYGASP